jgi:hypothetical protein
MKNNESKGHHGSDKGDITAEDYFYMGAISDPKRGMNLAEFANLWKSFDPNIDEK